MDPHKFKKHVETPNLGVSNWVIIQNGLFIKLGYSSKWVINQNGLLFEMGHYSKWVINRNGLLFEIGLLIEIWELETPNLGVSTNTSLKFRLKHQNIRFSRKF